MHVTWLLNEFHKFLFFIQISYFVICWRDGSGCLFRHTCLIATAPHEARQQEGNTEESDDQSFLEGYQFALLGVSDRRL